MEPTKQKHPKPEKVWRQTAGPKVWCDKTGGTTSDMLANRQVDCAMLCEIPTHLSVGSKAPDPSLTIASTRMFGNDTPVTLTINAEAAQVRLVRLLASACADGIGYDFDAIEDVRIAMDECVNVAMARGGAGQSLTVEFRKIDSAMHARIVANLSDEPERADSPDIQDPLSMHIIASLTSQFAMEREGDHLNFHVEFHAPSR